MHTGLMTAQASANLFRALAFRGRRSFHITMTIIVPLMLSNAKRRMITLTRLTVTAPKWYLILVFSELVWKKPCVYTSMKVLSNEFDSLC